MLLALLTFLGSCGPQGSPAGTADADKVRELEQKVADLEQQLAANAPRARAHLGLEFVGDRKPLPAEQTYLKVLTTTPTPDPVRSDYPDCVAVSLCERLDGDQQETGEQLLVAATVFRNRRIKPAARLAVGTIVQANLVPFDSLPEDIQSIQRVDATDNFELPLLAAIGLRKTIVMSRHTVEPPGGEAPSQKDAIASSIEQIERRLEPHGSFEKWHKALEPLRQQVRSEIVKNGGGPLLKGKSLIRNLHYIRHEPNEQWPEPQVAYFTNLRDQLAAMGTDLIVVPFPEREQLSVYEIAADPPADGVVHPYRNYWHLKLLQAGVEVVDILPALIEATKQHEFVYYDALDGHPADGAVRTAASEIAKRLRRYGDLKPHVREVTLGMEQFAVPPQYKKFPKYAYEAPCYPAQIVRTADGEMLPRHSPKAPILLLGDSFIGKPHGYGVAGADLSAHLVKETGVLIRRMEVGGAGPQLMSHLARRGRDYTRGVKVLVYVFREDYMFGNDPDDAKYRWDIAELPK